MSADPRQGFRDTITSLAAARALAPDESGVHRKPGGPVYVTSATYERDMDDILKALRLLKEFQDRTAWSLRVLGILFAGVCTVAGVVAALVGAFRHG